MSFDGVNQDIALAFADTACAEAEISVGEGTFEDILESLARVGALDAATARRLRTKFGGRSTSAAAAKRVLAFRAVIIEALEALRHGKSVPEGTLQRINAELLACGCRRELVRDGAGFRTRIAFEIEKPADIVMPLATSLAELLANVDPTRVKQCKGPHCSCYFVDTSRNRTREWCSMDRCGNRQKVATYYRRSKG